MSRIRIVGGSIIKTSKGQTIIESLEGDYSSIAGKQNIWDGGENGNTYHDYVAPEKKIVEEKPIDETKNFISGWWSKDYQGNNRVNYNKDNTGSRAELEDTVYFQLKVNKKIPLGTKIKFKLWDHDWSAFMSVFLPGVNLDDDNFGIDGKELFKMGTVKDVGEEYNRITLKLHLTPEWKEQLEADKGIFHLDNCLDFFWNFQFQDTTYTTQQIILSVYYKRNLFITEAYPSKYKFPEVIDSQTGDFIVFLKNEAGDVVGSLESKIDDFYAVRVTIKADYQFEGRTNKVTKKLYEERINLHTGKVTNKKLFEVKELASFRAKNSKTISTLESSTVSQVSKKLSDYYNIYDIGNYGLKCLQTAMEVLGYIDLFNDIKDGISGKNLSMYDTNGIMIAAAEQGLGFELKTATALAAKRGGTLTAKEIASLALPEWISPLTFSMAIFEEAITKPFVAQVMQDISDTMFEKMERAKRGGFEAVRLLLDLDSNVANYYILVQGIPQNKHDKVFAGKIKTYADLNYNNALYRSKAPNSKTYIYLLQKIKPDDSDEMNYNIDTIFI